MSRKERETTYCVDTSSLVGLRVWRPRKKYPEPWKRLDELIQRNRLIAPGAVLRELQERDDALLRWARKRGGIFKRNSKALVEHVQAILDRFPDFADPQAPNESADPFVVALAVQESSGLYPPEVVVVTEEKYAPGKTRIPHVCEWKNIRYLTIHQMFVFEGWQF